MTAQATLPRLIDRVARDLRAAGHAPAASRSLALGTVHRWSASGPKALREAAAEAVTELPPDARRAARREPWATPAEEAQLAEAARSRLVLAEGLIMALGSSSPPQAAVESARALASAEGRSRITLGGGGGEATRDVADAALHELHEAVRPDRLLAEVATTSGRPTAGGVQQAKGGQTRYTGSGPGTPAKKRKGRAGAATAEDAAAKEEFERLHPRAAKGRVGGGSWIQKGAGMEGEPDPQAAQLQNRLNALGYPITRDGRFGPQTEMALQRFQRDNGIDPNGALDDATTDALRSANPRSEGAPQAQASRASGGGYGAKYEGAAGREARKKQNEEIAGDADLGRGGRQNVAGQDVNTKGEVVEKKGDKEKSGGSSRRSKRRSGASAGDVLYRGIGMGEARSDKRVKDVQEMLDELGYDLGAAGVDGRLGPRTERAIKLFQRRMGLRVDGILGMKTRRALNRAQKNRRANEKAKPASTLEEAAVDRMVTPRGRLEARLEEAVAQRRAASQNGDGRAFGAALARERVLRARIEEASKAPPWAKKDSKGEGMKRCPSCSWRNPKGKTKCSHCGADLAKKGDAKLEEADPWGGKPGPNAPQVGPAARKKLNPLVRHYMKMAHPFTACVRDNTKRFGQERSERICAVLKDIGTGTTKWRKGSKKVSEAELVEAAIDLLWAEAGIESEEDADALAEYLEQAIEGGGDRPSEAAVDGSPFGGGSGNIVGIPTEERTMDEGDIMEAAVRQSGGRWQLRDRLGRWRDMGVGDAVRVTRNVSIDRPASDQERRMARARIRFGSASEEDLRSGGRSALDAVYKHESLRVVGHDASGVTVEKPSGERVLLPAREVESNLRADESGRDDAELRRQQLWLRRQRLKPDVPLADRPPKASPGTGGLPANPYGPNAPGPRRAFEAGVLDARRGMPRREAAGAENQAAYDKGYRGAATPKASPGTGTELPERPYENYERGRRVALGRSSGFHLTGGELDEEAFDDYVRGLSNGQAIALFIDLARNGHHDLLAHVSDNPDHDPVKRRDAEAQMRLSATHPEDYEPKASPPTGDRDAAAAAAHPEGSAVTTTVHGIGGRSEKVTGRVVGHKRGQLVVETPAHGRIMVPLDKAEGAGAADPATVADLVALELEDGYQRMASERYPAIAAAVRRGDVSNEGYPDVATARAVVEQLGAMIRQREGGKASPPTDGLGDEEREAIQGDRETVGFALDYAKVYSELPGGARERRALAKRAGEGTLDASDVAAVRGAIERRLAAMDADESERDEVEAQYLQDALTALDDTRIPGRAYPRARAPQASPGTDAYVLRDSSRGDISVPADGRMTLAYRDQVRVEKGVDEYVFKRGSDGQWRLASIETYGNVRGVGGLDQPSGIRVTDAGLRRRLERTREANLPALADFNKKRGRGSGPINPARLPEPKASPGTGQTRGAGKRRRVVGTPEEERARGERNARMERLRMAQRAGTSPMVGDTLQTREHGPVEVVARQDPNATTHPAVRVRDAQGREAWVLSSDLYRGEVPNLPPAPKASPATGPQSEITDDLRRRLAAGPGTSGGATLATKTGRSGSGRLRNFRSMRDEKFRETVARVFRENNDPEAMEALAVLARERGVDLPPAGNAGPTPPPVPPTRGGAGGAPQPRGGAEGRTGRSGAGRLRNFGSMSDAKLAETARAVAAEANDAEAIQAVMAELRKRGKPSPPIGGGGEQVRLGLKPSYSGGRGFADRYPDAPGELTDVEAARRDLRRTFRQGGPLYALSGELRNRSREDTEGTQRLLNAMGAYNDFSPGQVGSLLAEIEADWAGIRFGREGSPVLYLRPSSPEAVGRIREYFDRGTGLDRELERVAPDEFAVMADGIVRMWWD